MASGWNLWIWLPCIGVVSGCCCKEVYRLDILTIISNFSYSTYTVEPHYNGHCGMECRLCQNSRYTSIMRRKYQHKS